MADASPPPPSPEALAAVGVPATGAPATFRGTLACADCPGIRTTLELESDGTAVLTRLYIEGEPDVDPVFVERGHWSRDDQGRLLILTDGDTLWLALDPNGVTMLDRSGQPYESNLPHTLERVPGGEAAELGGTAWRVVEPEPAADSNTLPGLRFGSDGRVSGSDGCNQLTGLWAVTDGALVFESLASTLMACPGEVDVVARAVTAALAATASYRIDGTVLVLVGDGGVDVARLRPAP